MIDTEIIEMLFNRDEKALNAIAEQYSRLYRSILSKVLDDDNDIEECANDVLLSLWNSIPPQTPDHLPSYICCIARRTGVNRYYFNTRQKRNSKYQLMLSEIEESVPSDELTDTEDDNQISIVISQFIKGLDAVTRILFVRRYFYMESVTDLSQRFALQENVVSSRLYRARKKLKKELIRKEIIL